MALILRIGLVASLVAFVGSLTAYLALHPSASYEPNAPNTSRAFLNLPGLLGGLAAGSPGAFLTLGVLLLVATPIVRVASGLYYFQRDGERTMAAIALTVLVLLVLGLVVLGPLIR